MKKEIRKNKIKNQIADEFRGLRTNLEFSSLGNEIKSIAVTSSLFGEGKSTVIANLAVAMANIGKRVVIVDCDLRKPTIHKRFSLPNSKGLTDILVLNSAIEKNIISTDILNLYVIPSGQIRPNPSELLGSKKMKAILNELTITFDMVLIDTPPVLYLSDAKILSALSQGTIIVTAYGISERNALLSTKEKIEKVGGKILGVVINKIPDIYSTNY